MSKQKPLKINKILWLEGVILCATVINLLLFIINEQSFKNYNQVSSMKNDFIKWVDCNVTKEALECAYQYDIDSYGKEIHVDWITLLAYAAAKNGGEFPKSAVKDIENFADQLINQETTVNKATGKMKYFTYYEQVYHAILDGYVGEYSMPDGEKKYGLKAYHPIAKGFPYQDYDDFGVSRSYGYHRPHLGHDMMGQIGTPIICTEDGYVEALGWNQYGGWRIGIRSLDKKRYYYYAHLRQNYPYQKSLKEGNRVTAGEVIGYMGHTGYSSKENVNNIDAVHLHYGIQLIFDESQKECDNEIWINPYELCKFLYQHQSEVSKITGTKEWRAK